MFAALWPSTTPWHGTCTLGREGLVPARRSRTHVKHLSPHVDHQPVDPGYPRRSDLRRYRQDPVSALFTWLTQLGTLAIIVLMALASFAIVAFFASHRDLDTYVARTIIAPIVGGGDGRSRHIRGLSVWSVDW